MAFKGDNVEALMKPPCETKIFDSEADPSEVSTSDEEHDAEPAVTQSSDRWVSPRANAAKDTAAKDTVVLHPSDISPWVGAWVGEDDDEDVPDSWDSLADD